MKTIEEVFFSSRRKKEENAIKKYSFVSERVKTLHKMKIGKYLDSICPKPFVWNESSKNLYSAMLDYFTGSESSKIDLNKGIYLVGNTGSGKTFMFKMFREYTREIIRLNTFKHFKFSELVNEYTKNGIASLDSISEFLRHSEMSAANVYIEDFQSKDEKASHYKNSENIAEAIIDKREYVFNRYKKLTFICSNVHPEKSDLDSRTVGRISEIMTVIEYENDNFRI